MMKLFIFHQTTAYDRAEGNVHLFVQREARARDKAGLISAKLAGFVNLSI